MSNISVVTMGEFEKLVNRQLLRIEEMKSQGDFINYSRLDKIIIGVCSGDGIGPSITCQAERVMKYILNNELNNGKVEIRNINDLTIEKRAEEMQAIPTHVLVELKQCNVILKGPTTTPRKGDNWPNIESANVAMRKELDLFANVRPIRIPNQKIDWVFYRENTEGSYAAGKEGLNVTKELGIDFTIATTIGCERIVRAAFEYAKKNGKSRVTAVTKANIIKITDGKFLECFYSVSKEYPDIKADDWYIDIMTAKLLDEKRRGDFQVMVLPNLYGDILSDEAAELQGGVGTAGSANIGKKYAMFEAIHGSAPRMVMEGRDKYADPSSMLRAVAMLLSHIGYIDKSRILDRALDICSEQKKKVITGRSDGATGEEFADYLLDVIAKLEA